MTGSKTADIAIVGGGFSGTMVLHHLVDKADKPLSIYWFDAMDSVAKGVAYSTPDSVHLLNVPAANMGAFAKQKDDFSHWITTPEAKEAIKGICPESLLSGKAFAPRKLYGVYLESILHRTEETARQKKVQIHRISARVTDAQATGNEPARLRLTYNHQEKPAHIDVAALVLATGNLPPQRFAFQSGMVQGKCGYVENVWQTPDHYLYPHSVNELPADAETVVIGTGLTMVDTILTLKARGYKGTITAISRHGLLPASHVDAKPYPAWAWVEQPQKAPHKVSALLAGLRAEAERAAEQGYDWRAVVDSLRPVTQELWSRLSIHERRRFMQKLFTFWNVHRHRMAPEIHTQLRSMQQNGSLKIISGKIYYVGTDDDGLTVAFRRRGTNRVESIRSPLVLNCTGPTYDVANSDHQLLRNLRDNGLITVGPLRVGIETAGDESAKGKLAGAIFPIGTLRVGELLECTAVPELREQAEKIAERALKCVKQEYDVGLLAHMVI